MRRLRLGVIGLGRAFSLMLPTLAHHPKVEIVAGTDVRADARERFAREFAAKAHPSADALAGDPNVEAIYISTPHELHAAHAQLAAAHGKHILVEKPMCFSVGEGEEMIAAAERAGVTLMVAYNKRYDPGFLRLRDEVKQLKDLRLVRVTTLESPLKPYVGHYVLHSGSPLDAGTAAGLRADNDQRITRAIGTADPLSRHAYHLVLLDSMVHEFNVIRGVLGEPDELTFANVRENGLTLALRYGSAECLIAWVDLPGIARYHMEFAFYAPDRRLTLSFPSPFLRNAPTLFIDETGDGATARASRSEEVVSYLEGFKEELIHFHHCVTTGARPTTSGSDSLRDIALCQSVIAAHATRRPVPRPTDITPKAA